MSQKESFFTAHWDWLVAAAAAGVLAGAFAFFAGDFGLSGDEAASACSAQLAAIRPAHDGVAEQDMELFRAALQGVKNPPYLKEVDGKSANFLVSERRLACTGEGADAVRACGRPIPAEAAACPFCGLKQPTLVKIELDSDHDGMPNDFELKAGLNASDGSDAAADKDGDGFTNLEEYEAKTDPNDAKSHPDYLDSLSVAGELRQTYLPFYLREATPCPDGRGGTTWSATFPRLNAKKYEDKVFRVKVGEALKAGKIDSGWKLAAVDRKTEEVVVKGGGGMKTRKEVFLATLERAADKLRLQIRDGDKKVAVETQASLVYRRGGEKNFTVGEGSVIELNGEKFKVVKLRSAGKKCEVTLESVAGGKRKTISGT